MQVGGTASYFYGNTSTNYDGSRVSSTQTQSATETANTTQVASGAQTVEDQAVNESTASATATTAQVQVVTETQNLEPSSQQANIIDTYA